MASGAESDEIVEVCPSAFGPPDDVVDFVVGGQHRFQHVLVIADDNKITITDLDGVILIEHTRPAPGATYVGNGRPRGPRPRGPRPKTDETSPMS